MEIILCDDHQIVALSLVALFEAYGHAVVAVAVAPADLSELVDRHEPDVCVLDLHYDGTPGVAASLAAIESCAGRTDLVVVTGNVDARVRRAALAAGASAVVSKATSGESLVALVEGRLAEPAPLTPVAPATNRYFLTPRESQVLRSLADGDSTDRMAVRLDMSSATVRSHVQSLLIKLGVHNRTAAVAVGHREGLVPRRRRAHANGQSATRTTPGAQQ